MRIEALNGVNNLVDVTPLLPAEPKKPKSLVDILTPPNKDQYPVLYNILVNNFQMHWAVISYTEEESDLGYESYLQFPNAQIRALAETIVSPGDTNDEKMYKIEQWVQDNITYVSDEENYGSVELWAYPNVTLEKKSGDCEDGSFLIHSLALHAGISPDRLRTYGGLVYADPWGATTGGHAWTTYKRETDDEWIITDWCYWATDKPIAERQPMTDDMKYIDDFFYIQVTRTVETPYANEVRNPIGLVRYAAMPRGAFINIKV